ncbi:MAG: methionyl-tRNA formyltransferase [bacterium]
MRTIFMGTPQFSCPYLEALIKNRYRIAGVVTQPDRPRGRGRVNQYSPVKKLALEHGLPVYQPSSLKKDQFFSLWQRLSPDLVIVVAYGQILPAWIINAPLYGCINIHASCLPNYRGAAPINWAIINGEKTTGITLILMDEGMDTGAILSQEKLRIDPDDTAESLSNKLSHLGAHMLPMTIKGLIEGTITPLPQQNHLATYTPKLTKEMGLISWEKDAVTINRLIKGLFPWPGCYTYLDGVRIKILNATISSSSNNEAGVPGQIIAIEPRKGLCVHTGNGVLQILEVQPENKKRMNSWNFASGWRQPLPGRIFNQNSSSKTDKKD